MSSGLNTPLEPESESVLVPVSRSRVVEAYVVGDPSAERAAFYNHGIPGSGFDAKAAEDIARECGIKIIGLSRPGMGRSTYDPHRKLRDWSNDVRRVADYHKINKATMMGFSGGGMYALAAAHDIPDRVDQTIIAASPAPSVFTGTNINARLMYRTFFALGRRTPDMATHLAVWAMRLYQKWVGGTSDPGMPEADKRVLLNSSAREMMGASVARAFAQGVSGVSKDVSVMSAPLYFRPKDIQGKVHILHGTDDISVDPQAADWWKDRLNDADSRIFKFEGHLFMVQPTDDIRAHVKQILSHPGN